MYNQPVSGDYPNSPAERDRWILAQRPARNAPDPWRPYAFLLEDERAASGDVVPVATVFLTNRECPWRCVYCDLWKNTLGAPVPAGAIPAQIDYVLGQLAAARGPDAAAPAEPVPRQIKLYNSGSFFDPEAVRPGDYRAIAERVRGFERVIVECHPALVNERVLRFRELLGGRTALEVAMGLETAHPQVLAMLNKRMTLEDFARAAELLRRHGVALRSFIMVKPPFLMDEAAALDWARRSVDFAFAAGASVAVLIPTRGGNGAMEELARRGLFAPPRLATLEAALAYGIQLRAGRVFADLWDLGKFAPCGECMTARKARIEAMNLRQEVLPPVECARCGGA